MTRKRTDVHRPSALVTEDYEFVACGYYGSIGEPGYSPLAHPPHAQLLDEGWHFAGEGGGNCDHCGARIKYWAILKHVPSHTLIRVGETCLDNRFERSTAEFHTLRKQAALDRQAQRTKHRRARFFAEYPDAEEAFEWCKWCIGDGGYGYGWEGTRHKFVAALNRDGEVSQRFLKMIMRDMARTERYEEERAAREAADAAEQATAEKVIEGRVELTGTILATKTTEGDFGMQWKMLLKDDRGFKVWGTVGRCITDAVDGPLKGARISFTATVESSRDDDYFGFYKRPTKATCLAEAGEEE